MWKCQNQIQPNSKIQIVLLICRYIKNFVLQFCQVKHSVEAGDVKLVTQLVQLRESLAKEDLTRGTIGQDKYQRTVEKMKQKLIHTVLKFQNKL